MHRSGIQHARDDMHCLAELDIDLLSVSTANPHIGAISSYGVNQAVVCRVLAPQKVPSSLFNKLLQFSNFAVDFSGVGRLEICPVLPQVLWRIITL